MKILFTICGRAGSKGIKNKNIRNFLDIPLPLYTLSAIDLYLKKNSNIIYDIDVNTDSIELKNILCNNKQREVHWIEREEALAGDRVSKVDVIKNTYTECLKKFNCQYDMVVDLDITSPLRTVNDLENLIETQSSKLCDITFSVTDARRNPYFNMVKKTENGYKKVIDSNFTARQQAPEIFDMNASLYAYSPDFLSSNKSMFDGYCEIIKMKDTGILDLDHENDFELMEIIANYLINKGEEFCIIKENCKYL